MIFLLVWGDFFFAHCELPDSEVSVKLFLSAQRFYGEDGTELFEHVLRRPRGLEDARLRPKINEVFEDEQFRGWTVEDDNCSDIVIVNH